MTWAAEVNLQESLPVDLAKEEDPKFPMRANMNNYLFSQTSNESNFWSKVYNFIFKLLTSIGLGRGLYTILKL